MGVCVCFFFLLVVVVLGLWLLFLCVFCGLVVCEVACLCGVIFVSSSGVNFFSFFRFFYTPFAMFL